MKKLTLSLLVAASVLGAQAGVYTRVTKFDKIGTEFQDTFLIVAEYANNAYIFDGQNATGKNYELIENFSGTQITGDYTENECILYHNQYHSYDKLCSIRCTGDGDRGAGGYYLAGVSKNNGITFSKGETNVEFTWQGEYGVDIVTKSGSGNFLFNQKDHGFKFYQTETNMQRPVLYVKGNGAGYVGEDESVNTLDINYVQADLYARYSDFTKNLYFWDLRLNQSESDDAVPRIETSILTATMISIAGDYSQETASTMAGWAASDSYIQFPSSEGSTQAKLTSLDFTLTPVSRYNEHWYNYHIVLNCIDSNKKRWKLDKVLPIFCTFTDRDPNNKENDLETDTAYNMTEKVPTAISAVSADELNIFAIDKTIIGPDDMTIFDLTGLNVTKQNGSLTGVYIVKCGEKVAKIVVR